MAQWFRIWFVTIFCFQTTWHLEAEHSHTRTATNTGISPFAVPSGEPGISRNGMQLMQEECANFLSIVLPEKNKKK